MLVKKGSSLGGCQKDYTFKPRMDCFVVDQIFDLCSPAVISILQQCVGNGVAVKAHMSLEVQLLKMNFADQSVKRKVRCEWSTESTNIALKEIINIFISDCLQDLDEKLESHLNNKRKWIIGQMLSLSIFIISVHSVGSLCYK
jgi:hypothetical protein